MRMRHGVLKMFIYQVEPNNWIFIVIPLAVQEMSKCQAHTKLQGSQILLKLYALNENKFIRFNLCRQSGFLSSSFWFEHVCQEMVKCRATYKNKLSFQHLTVVRS